MGLLFPTEYHDLIHQKDYEALFLSYLLPVDTCLKNKTGLTSGQIKWAGIFKDFFRDNGYLTERQLVVLFSIYETYAMARLLEHQGDLTPEMAGFLDMFADYLP